MIQHHHRGLDEIHPTARPTTPSDTRLDAATGLQVLPLRPSARFPAATGAERAEASA